MTLTVKHSFVSVKTDGTDPTLVKPSDWNAEHQILVSSGTIVGRQSSGVGAAEALSPSQTRTVADVDRAGTFSGVNTQTGTAYTLVASDRGKVVLMNNAADNVLTIPSNASVEFPVGTVIGVLQDGAGQTEIDIDTDTLSSYGGKRKMRVQYSFAILLKVTATRWVISGDIAS